MLGNRGATTGDELDAFSRKSRRILSWRPGETKKLKRAFAKRARLDAKREVRKEEDE